jgi:hypothetical protein
MSMSTETEPLNAAEEATAEDTKESSVLRIVGWLSVGMVVAALGVFVGREMYCRHRFNHRTPYDFYAHAGEQQKAEFGLGI